MRTTIKETNIHNERTGNMKGPRKLTVYDPNDISEQQLKKLILIETLNLNL